MESTSALVDEIVRATRRGGPVAYLGGHLVLVRARDLKIFLDARDMSLTPHLLLDGEWESWITRVFLESVGPGMTVVDVGANIGYYTLLAARAVGPSGKVWAFEPEPGNCRLMAKSVEINGFSETVRVIPKALSDREGTAELHLDTGMHQASHSLFAGMVDNPSESVTVEVTTLDDVLEPGTRVDVMKLDAEGAEPLVFAGMQRVLADNPDILLIMEFCPDHFRRAELDPEAFLTEIRKTGFPLRRVATTGTVEPVTEEEALGPGYQTLFLRRGM
jgi:FkbM family methyltransferase